MSFRHVVGTCQEVWLTRLAAGHGPGAAYPVCAGARSATVLSSIGGMQVMVSVLFLVLVLVLLVLFLFTYLSRETKLIQYFMV